MPANNGGSRRCSSSSPRSCLYLAFRGTSTLPHDEEAGIFQWFNGLRDAIDESRATNPLFLYVIDPIRRSSTARLPSCSACSRNRLDRRHRRGRRHRCPRRRLEGRAPGGHRLREPRRAGPVGREHRHAGPDAGRGRAVAADRHPARHPRRPERPLPGVRQPDPRRDADHAGVRLPRDHHAALPDRRRAAAIATLIYAMPAAIRITSLAIRAFPATTVEAADVAGRDRSQTLRKVQLPLARRVIALGVNQTIMLALGWSSIDRPHRRAGARRPDHPGASRTRTSAWRSTRGSRS